MSVLLAVVLLFAVLSLIAAAAQASAMVRLAPAGERLGSYLPLGWWRFRQLELKAGPAAATHLAIYKRAVIAFVVFLVLGVVLSGWAVNQRAEAAIAGLDRRFTTEFAVSTDLRRVAVMPGAPVLES